MWAAKLRKSVFTLVFVTCLSVLFYPGLVRSQIPAFRDTYHFYYPQAVWLDERAGEGEFFPRWNAEEGLGSSVAGQTTTALYYPLRVIWFIPALTLPQRLSVFIVAHLIIAYWGILFASDRLKLSTPAARLAAISYSLSCPVFFQHTNLIYLCSASWIGFALGGVIAACRSQQRSHLSSCLVFSASVALMLLGGDPHTAVNSLLVAASIFVAIGIGNWRKSGGTPVVEPLKISGLRFASWMAIAVAVIASGTAVQWIPAARWSRHSARLASSQNHRVAEAITEPGRSLDSLTARVEPPRHRVYDFSVPPWHIATMLWPTLGGHYLPLNSRWLSAFPAEGRMWIPSLYFGCIPCLLVLTTIRSWRQVNSWLLGLGIFALLAASGNYSLVWLAREFFHAIGLQRLAASLPPDHVGCVYWILTWMVPGYSAFRYPAKWTVWMVAGLSLAAGQRLDERSNKGQSDGFLSPTFRGSVIAVSIGLTLAAVLNLVYLRDAAGNWRLGEPDAWLGIPQCNAVSLTLIVAALVPVTCLFFTSRFKIHRASNVVVFTLVEMTLVASNWCIHIDPPAASSHMRAASSNAADYFVWSDASEAEIANQHRDSEKESFVKFQAHYQNQFLLGKLASVEHVGDLGASQSIRPRFVSQLLTWLRKNDNQSSAQPELDNALAMVGVTHRLARSEETLYWKPVPEPQPLCQLCDKLGKPIDRREQPTWIWRNHSELVISLAASQPSSLLVRQFNDGGWAGKIQLEDGRIESVELSSRVGALIELPIPKGTISLSLSRKWLW